MYSLITAIAPKDGTSIVKQYQHLDPEGAGSTYFASKFLILLFLIGAFGLRPASLRLTGFAGTFLGSFKSGNLMKVKSASWRQESLVREKDFLVEKF